MLLSEAHDRFLRYCAAERNHSPETIKAYRQASRRFLEWLEESGHGDPPLTERVSASTRTVRPGSSPNGGPRWPSAIPVAHGGCRERSHRLAVLSEARREPGWLDTRCLPRLL
jgi:hypothetical protein